MVKERKKTRSKTHIPVMTCADRDVGIVWGGRQAMGVVGLGGRGVEMQEERCEREAVF